ncbi:MAG: hypothetical protein HKL82_05825 [Acidimicrobiaceae bacterium]|nr:hypothetical protein [Acidimicrobiaceae bacterium]
MAQIAIAIPVVYERLKNGWSEENLLAARGSKNPNERMIGETYGKMFNLSGSGSPLKVALDGGRLVMEDGSHRVRAAQKAGVVVLPVVVKARTEHELDHLEEASVRRLEDGAYLMSMEKSHEIVGDATETAQGFELHPEQKASQAAVKWLGGVAVTGDEKSRAKRAIGRTAVRGTQRDRSRE